MKKFFTFAASALVVTAATLSPVLASGKEAKIDLTKHIPAAQLKERIQKYAQVDLAYDESVLSKPERDALIKLVQAAGVMDGIFLRQVWEGNVGLREKLRKAAATDTSGTVMADLYHFFRINFGPWDRLEEDAPFIGQMEKPAGAGFYPTDMTEAEFKAWIEQHPDDAEAFRGFFSCIRRDGNSLIAVPYSAEYKDLLAKAAALLNEAADILSDPESKPMYKEGVDYSTLVTFLRSRAAAFASNDYFQSDMDWMDVANNIIDVTIGPYEVYEDGLFGYKASFEAFIAIRNPADSRRLADLKDFLPGMERNLPIPDEHKNLDRGSESPISVVDLVFASGDTKAGVQTIAFNLPNDERVREAKGSKKVMLKNISRAKFDKILVPIANVVLDPSQRGMVEFDIYFSNVLMHELSHGLGPGHIRLADGTETTVSRELKTLYPPLEEAKADIMGLYNTAYLVRQGYLPQEHETKAYVNFLPGFFRAIRFGATSAHGKANMMEYNYMKEKGAITLDEGTGYYKVNLDKMPAAARAMTEELCMIQALGDYEAAEKFIAKYGKVPPEVERQLAKLKSIPTDIEPVYAAEKFLR
jgi:hypothetical protein